MEPEDNPRAQTLIQNLLRYERWETDLPGAAKIGHPASLRSRFGFNHHCSKINLTDRRSYLCQ